MRDREAAGAVDCKGIAVQLMADHVHLRSCHPDPLRERGLSQQGNSVQPIVNVDVDRCIPLERRRRITRAAVEEALDIDGKFTAR